MEAGTNRLWLLTQLELFSGLEHGEAQRVAEVLSERSCHVGDDIQLRPAGDTVYIVKRGRVRVESGKVAVGILGPGQIFGTSSLFGSSRRRERVVAMEEVILCEAPAGTFLRAMTSHPTLAARTAQLLARQLDALQQSFEHVAEGSVEARLAALVLQMAECDKDRFVRDLSQAALARLIGASRESVSRVLTGWEKSGLIRMRYRTLQLVDEKRLRSRLRSVRS